MRKRKLISYFFIYGLTLISILGVVWSLTASKEFTELQSWFEQAILPYGSWAMVVFVILQAAQVIFTPISHYAVGMFGGFLYGPYLGGVLNWIGRMLGHLIAFVLARKFGRPLAEKYIEPETMTKFDHYLSGDDHDKFNLQSALLFLIYFLPFFPDDEISYIAGLTRMNALIFVVCNAFGHLGGSFGLAYIGSGKTSMQDPIFWIILGLTFVGFIGAFFLGRKAKQNKRTN